MSMCVKEEILQAYVDRELPGPEMESVAAHLAECAACSTSLEVIRATNLKVETFLNSLAPEEVPVVAPVSIAELSRRSAASRLAWTAVVAGGALAAGILLLVMMVRRPQVNTAYDSSRNQPVIPISSSATKDESALPVRAGISVEKTATIGKTTHVRATKMQLKVLNFQALDNRGPIEMGMIYRVNLPATFSGNGGSSKGIPAEVIVDESGQVRAIRFLQ